MKHKVISMSLLLALFTGTLFAADADPTEKGRGLFTLIGEGASSPKPPKKEATERRTPTPMPTSTTEKPPARLSQSPNGTPTEAHADGVDKEELARRIGAGVEAARKLEQQKREEEDIKILRTQYTAATNDVRKLTQELQTLKHARDHLKPAVSYAKATALTQEHAASVAAIVDEVRRVENAITEKQQVLSQVITQQVAAEAELTKKGSDLDERIAAAKAGAPQVINPMDTYRQTQRELKELKDTPENAAQRAALQTKITELEKGPEPDEAKIKEDLDNAKQNLGEIPKAEADAKPTYLVKGSGKARSTLRERDLIVIPSKAKVYPAHTRDFRTSDKKMKDAQRATTAFPLFLQNQIARLTGLQNTLTAKQAEAKAAQEDTQVIDAQLEQVAAELARIQALRTQNKIGLEDNLQQLRDKKAKALEFEALQLKYKTDTNSVARKIAIAKELETLRQPQAKDPAPKAQGATPKWTVDMTNKNTVGTRPKKTWLNHFKTVKTDIEQRKPRVEASLDRAQEWKPYTGKTSDYSKEAHKHPKVKVGSNAQVKRTDYRAEFNDRQGAFMQDVAPDIKEAVRLRHIAQQKGIKIPAGVRTPVQLENHIALALAGTDYDRDQRQSKLLNKSNTIDAIFGPHTHENTPATPKQVADLNIAMPLDCADVEGATPDVCKALSKVRGETKGRKQGLEDGWTSGLITQQKGETNVARAAYFAALKAANAINVDDVAPRKARATEQELADARRSYAQTAGLNAALERDQKDFIGQRSALVSSHEAMSKELAAALK